MKKPRVVRALHDTVPIHVRFSEVDSMGVVWHGNYVKYLEDAREKMGTAQGMGYMDVYRNGYMIPVVNMNIDYKMPMYYDHPYTIHIWLLDEVAAKIKCYYEIRNADNQVCVTAETTQVFIDLKGELQLLVPDFYSSWKTDKPWKTAEL